MSPWKVILATLVIFACGVATGGFLFRKPAPLPASAPPQAAAQNPPAGPIQQQKDFLKRIDRHLDLTSQQKERVEVLLKESQERTKQIRDRISPAIKAEIKRFRDEVRAELTAEQQAKFDEATKPKAPRKQTASNAPPAEPRSSTPATEPDKAAN